MCTRRENGKTRKIVMPSTRCSLNTSGELATRGAASPRKVTTCCAQVMSRTISPPSRCCAETLIE
jgi:hypothetical protein